MAVIAEGSFSESHARLIERALSRAYRVEDQAVRALQPVRRGTSHVLWNEIERCFGVDRQSPHVQLQLATIIRAYKSAELILRSNQCLITSKRMDKTVATYDYDRRREWGMAEMRSHLRAPGFQYEIQVGPAFLSGSSFGYEFAIRNYPRTNDVGLLQAFTLLHEALHFHNGEGHASLGPLLNPYSYEYFFYSVFCLMPALYTEGPQRD
jgi:hypothetical protein